MQMLEGVRRLLLHTEDKNNKGETAEEDAKEQLNKWILSMIGDAKLRSRYASSRLDMVLDPPPTFSTRDFKSTKF